MVETWLCKLFLSSFIFFSPFYSAGWLSFTCIQTWRTQIQPNPKKGTRNTRNWWILYLFFCATQFNKIVHQGIESQAQMIFCLICAFIQMNENRAAFSPFIAYPSLGFYSSCLLSFDENTRTRTEREKKRITKEKKGLLAWWRERMVNSDNDMHRVRARPKRPELCRQARKRQLTYWVLAVLTLILTNWTKWNEKKSDHPFSALDLMNWTPLARKWIDEDATNGAHKKQQHRTEIIFLPI